MSLEGVFALIEPHYPMGRPAGGRPPLPLVRMYRIYCLQRWYTNCIRAVVEHPFQVVKLLWGYAHVRYRGIVKKLA